MPKLTKINEISVENLTPGSQIKTPPIGKSQIRLEYD